MGTGDAKLSAFKAGKTPATSGSRTGSGDAKLSAFKNARSSPTTTPEEVEKKEEVTTTPPQATTRPVTQAEINAIKDRYSQGMALTPMAQEVAAQNQAQVFANNTPEYFYSPVTRTYQKKGTTIIRETSQAIATPITKEMFKAQAAGTAQAQDVQISQFSQKAYDISQDISGKIRTRTGEMKTTGNNEIGRIGLNFVASTVEGAGMVPGGAEVLAQRPGTIKNALVVGSVGTAAGMAQQARDDPKQLIGDIGAAFIVGYSGGSAMGGTTKQPIKVNAVKNLKSIDTPNVFTDINIKNSIKGSDVTPKAPPEINVFDKNNMIAQDYAVIKAGRRADPPKVTDLTTRNRNAAAVHDYVNFDIDIPVKVTPKPRNYVPTDQFIKVDGITGKINQGARIPKASGDSFRPKATTGNAFLTEQVIKVDGITGRLNQGLKIPKASGELAGPIKKDIQIKAYEVEGVKARISSDFYNFLNDDKGTAQLMPALQKQKPQARDFNRAWKTPELLQPHRSIKPLTTPAFNRSKAGISAAAVVGLGVGHNITLKNNQAPRTPVYRQKQFQANAQITRQLQAQAQRQRQAQKQTQIYKQISPQVQDFNQISDKIPRTTGRGRGKIKIPVLFSPDFELSGKKKGKRNKNAWDSRELTNIYGDINKIIGGR